MTLLTENPWPLSIVFAAVAMLCFLIMAASGRGKFMLLGIGSLLMIGVVVMIEQMVVTPAEVVEGYARTLVARVKASDVEGTLELISPRNETLRFAAISGLKIVKADDDVSISDLEVTTSSQDTRAMSHFRVNGTFSAMGGSQYYPTRWEVDWQKTNDGWQVTEVRRLDPITGKTMGILER